MEYLLGLILPPFIDYLNKDVTNGKERAWITVIACFVVACILDSSVILHADTSNIPALLTLATALIAEATTVYNVWWKDSIPRLKLPGNGVGSTINP